MGMAFARKCFLVGTLALMASFVLEGDPVKDPKRVVNETTIDLGPLLRWWSKHEGERPLTAWVRVTGSVIGTNALGWTLDARVESRAGREHEPGAAKSSGDGQTKIILKHPPAQEFAEFESLAERLKALNEEHSQLSAQEAKDKSEENALHTNGVRGRGAALQARYAKQNDQEAKERLKEVDKQIEELRLKLASFPNPAKYTVDTFALELGQAYGGLPVYDRGQVWK